MSALGETLGQLSAGIGPTCMVAFESFAVGALLAVPLVAARTSAFAPLRVCARIYIELLRGIPPIVLLFIVFYGFASEFGGYTPNQTSVIGFSAISAAYLAEIYRSALASIAEGQWEASAALGMGRVAMLSKVIAPQALIVALAPSVVFLVSLLKDTSVASIIGVHEITQRAGEQANQSLDGMTVYLIAALMYVVLSVPVALFGRWVDKKSAGYLAA